MIFFVQDITYWKMGTAATHFRPLHKGGDSVAKVGYKQPVALRTKILRVGTV